MLGVLISEESSTRRCRSSRGLSRGIERIAAVGVVESRRKGPTYPVSRRSGVRFKVAVTRRGAQ